MKSTWSSIMLTWWFCVFCVIVTCGFGAGGNDFTCRGVQQFLEMKKWAVVKQNSPTGIRRPCGKEGRACCSFDEEDTLTSESRKGLMTDVRTDIGILHNILLQKVRKFNDFFTTLLLQSKKAFDDMFKATYGIVYEKNAHLFTDLFEKLEMYYSKGQVDLEEAMENFFNTLYQKMFTVLNSQYKFDDKYLTCVGDHMKELKPFGDVPQKLSVQIKRSFVATRTFAQGLAAAKDVVMNMQNMGLAGDCSLALMRMSHCQLCRGSTEVRACGDLCLNVMKGCLAYHTDLNTEWNNFIDAMDKVIIRLLGPFNIEYVVEPIDIKISEAIMNFQEDAQEVTSKVFTGCGRPFLNRSVRATRELKMDPYPFSRGNPKNFLTIENLIKEIRVKVKDSKNVWANLPFRICYSRNAALGDDEKNAPCWNGTHVARYTKAVTSNGLHSQASNPEVMVDTNKPRSILNEQVYILKTMTSKLKNAYNGYDVDWPDNEFSSGSYDGSGAGSGDDELPLEGSGDDGKIEEPDYGGGDVEYESSEPPHSTESESENLIPHGDDEVRPTPGRPNSSSTSKTRPSLFRCVVAYVFPIYVMWLGGLFN